MKCRRGMRRLFLLLLHPTTTPLFFFLLLHSHRRKHLNESKVSRGCFSDLFPFPAANDAQQQQPTVVTTSPTSRVDPPPRQPSFVVGPDDFASSVRGVCVFAYDRASVTYRAAENSIISLELYLSLPATRDRLTVDL